MSAFEYTAYDAEGREKKGVIEGETARQIRQLLRGQGLTPLSVEEVAADEKRRQSRTLFPRRGISSTELALVTRQLATLVRSGMTVDTAIETVARQVERRRLGSMLMAVHSRVREGRSMADGLAEFPHVFPELYRATVAAGEQSGHLDVVLERLADYTENRQQLRQKIQLALFYPALLTLMSVLVVSALLAYVVPQVVQVFANTGQELPLLTRGLIAVSDILRAYGLPGVVVAVIALWWFRHLLQRQSMQHRWHRLLHRLPLAGRLFRGVNTARFSRTFSILAASGVPILDAMYIAAQVLSSVPMREAVERAARRVREGSGVRAALEPSGYFPPMTLQLIASGEASGNLEQMLERAAANQERELETMVAALMGLFEPLLILLMGGVVLLIVLAILLPIFDLNQLVR
jgi:general secretion pathway protein F